MSARRKKPSGPPHVRVYAHEMRCPAWTTLDTDARALLIEMRALWTLDSRHRVYLSIRQIMDRLHIGQRRATAARDALLERGWIELVERGAFARKVRHATVYAVSMPDDPGAPRGYMSWHPPVAATTEISSPRAAAQKNTVAATATVGSHYGYRGSPATPDIPRVGSCSSYRESGFFGLIGSCHGYTDTATTPGVSWEGMSSHADHVQAGDTWTH